MRPLFFVLALCAGLWASAQTNIQDSAWIRDNYIKKEIMVPMRDGVRLFTAVYIPKDTTEAHPILMTRTPYSCAPYGENNFRPFWNTHWRYYMRHNYIIVLQDVRGRWMSEGTFMDVRPFNPNKKDKEIDEASDTYDAIEWLVNNLPHNNKRVGIFGISYPGFYSTMAALSGHPSLVAVSPQAPVTDWFMGDDFHHNGAFFQMDGFVFYSSFGKPRPKPTTVGSPGFNFPTRDAYKFYLEAATPKKLAELIGDSIAFWHEMYKHPNYDDWWKARNVRNFVQYIPPHTNTLVVGGLFDAEDCFGAWRTYEAIEQKAKNNNRIVMGPWYHGQWARGDGSSLGNVQFGSNTSLYYQNEIELPFFRYHLEGKGTLNLPEARIFFTGENQWRSFDRWPAANVQPTPLYLRANEQLSWSKPTATNSFSSYVSDPAKPVPYTEDVHFTRTIAYMTDDQRFANRRPDVLTFQTDVLTEDVTLAGPVIANLLASISTTDADFVVKLIDVFPSNFRYPGQQQEPAGRMGGGAYPMGDYQMLVRGEIMRGRYRNSFEKPEPFKPGKIETVKFELPDVAHTFKKGHRIMIQIQSSWFPLVDRNPQQFVNIYEADAKDYIPSTIRIWHDAKNASSIILPVLK
ncbi:MAG: CocE/NonD family hydrolase [Lacibacter sp.]